MTDEERYLLALKRKRAALAARDDMLSFAKLMMPKQDAHEDPDQSEYQVAKHHRVIAAALEEVEQGNIKRLIINCPPRHGKSQLASRMFPAWYLGRNPNKSVIVSTYNENFAADFGRDIRGIMQDPIYSQIFDVRLKSGAAAVDRLETEENGKIFLTGVGGSLTGRGASCFPAGTKVLTPDGEIFIEHIDISTAPCYVLAYDETDQTTKPRQIQAVAHRKAVGLRRITTASGRVVTATLDHPFYVEGRWVKAGELTTGNRLLRAVREGGDEVWIRDKQARKARMPLKMARSGSVKTVEDTVALVEDLHEEAIVYDIQVEEDHNFFANGLLVHNCILLDDPIKGREDADSPTKREKLWSWWNQVLKTRLMTSTGVIAIILTRWHEDDLVGRITDPHNSCYSASEAKKWKIIDLPALAKDKDVLGRKEGEALWPDRFPTSYLHEMREADPRGFQALYQGSPTPEKGNFFDGDRLRVYVRPTDRPPNDQLRFYIASDHAVSTKQDRDKTAIIPVGVDEHDNIWILDDVEWGRWETDVVVEKMLRLMQKYNPLFWWAERGHISKSIGPFLRKRMMEERVYVTIDEIVPIMDKQSRAQSISARISMGKVYMPTYASWYSEARDELLKFPFGVRDDFCDALSYIGLGLAKTVKPSIATPKVRGPERGTLGWIKAQSRAQERDRMVRNGGW